MIPSLIYWKGLLLMWLLGYQAYVVLMCLHYPTPLVIPLYLNIWMSYRSLRIALCAGIGVTFLVPSTTPHPLVFWDLACGCHTCTHQAQELPRGKTALTQSCVVALIHCVAASNPEHLSQKHHLHFQRPTFLL